MGNEKRIRRIGKFQMSEKILESPEAIDIFKQLDFIPLRVFKTSEGYYNLTGYSNLFDEIDTSDFLNDVPEYILSLSDDGTYDLKVEKL